MVLLLIGAALLAPMPASAKITVDGFGSIINSITGQILGVEKDEVEDEKEESEKTRAEQAQEKNIRELEQEKKTSQSRVQRLKISPFEDVLRVSTDEHDDTSSMEASESGSTDEDMMDDDQTEKMETEEVEVEADADHDVISLRAKNNAAYVIRNKVAAQSNFPLQVNLNTNELIVTTPKGAKIVTVLPDAAVQHMLAANVLDEIGGKGGILWRAEQERIFESTQSAVQVATESATASKSGEVTDVATTVVNMEETEDGVLAYKIEGYKTKKLLGFRKVTLPRTVYVSAETGEIVSIEQSWFDQIISFLSTD